MPSRRAIAFTAMATACSSRDDLSLLVKCVDVIHEIPDIFVNNSWSAVEAFHRQIGAAAIANHHEDFAIGRTQIPDVVGEIRRRNLAGLNQHGRRFADAVSRCAMTVRA